MFRMFFIVLPFAVSAVFRAGEARSVTSSDPVHAASHSDAVLRCQLNGSVPIDQMPLTVVCRKGEFGPHVHVHRHGRDDATMQDERYKNRTTVNYEALGRGIIVLTLSSVKQSDSGTYRILFPDLKTSCDILLIVAEEEQDDGTNRLNSTTAEPPKEDAEQPEDGWNRYYLVALVVLPLMGILIFALCYWKRRGRTARDGERRREVPTCTSGAVQGSVSLLRYTGAWTGTRN